MERQRHTMSMYSLLLILICMVLNFDVGNGLQQTVWAKIKNKYAANALEPRQSIPSSCRRSNFLKMDLCCMVPSGPFFTADVVKSCNPKKRSLNIWANSLQLNKLMQPNTGTMNLNNKGTVHYLCNIAKMMNCLFANASIDLNNPSFYEKSLSFFAHQRFVEHADPWYDVLYSLIEPFCQFKLFGEAVKPEYNSIMCPGARPSDPKVNTTLLPLLFTQYLENQIIALCPEPATPFTPADGCVKNLANYKSCSDGINRMIFTDKFYNFTQIALQNAKESLLGAQFSFAQFSSPLETGHESYEEIEYDY